MTSTSAYLAACAAETQPFNSNHPLFCLSCCCHSSLRTFSIRGIVSVAAVKCFRRAFARFLSCSA